MTHSFLLKVDGISKMEFGIKLFGCEYRGRNAVLDSALVHLHLCFSLHCQLSFMPIRKTQPFL